MSRHIKVILAASLGVVALSAVTIALIITNPADETSKDNPNSHDTEQPRATEQEQSGYTVTNLVKDISSIRIANPADPDGYSIVCTANGDYQVTELQKRITANDLAVPYDNGQLAALFAALTNLSVSLVEENVDIYELEKYGLYMTGCPEDLDFVMPTVVEIGEFVLIIGSDAPDEKSAYCQFNKYGRTEYYQFDESDYDVYAMPLVLADTLRKRGRHDWLNRVVFPEYNVETALDVALLAVYRADLDEEIVIEALPDLALEELTSFNSHRFISPTKLAGLELNPDTTVSVLYGMFGMSAVRAEWLAPDEESFEFFGLSEPSCVVTCILGGETFTLTLGNTHAESGGVYGMSSHVPGVVYLFDPMQLPWLRVEVERLLSESFLMPYIYSLNAVTVQAADAKLEFQITGTVEDNTITLARQALTPFQREQFGELYRYFITMKGEQLYNGEKIGEHVVTITYHYRDRSKSSDTLSLYKSENRRSVIQLNGEYVFTCRESYTTRLAENVAAFINGEKIVYDY